MNCCKYYKISIVKLTKFYIKINVSINVQKRLLKHKEYANHVIKIAGLVMELKKRIALNAEALQFIIMEDATKNVQKN